MVIVRFRTQPFQDFSTSPILFLLAFIHRVNTQNSIKSSTTHSHLYRAPSMYRGILSFFVRLIFQTLPLFVWFNSQSLLLSDLVPQILQGCFVPLAFIHTRNTQFVETFILLLLSLTTDSLPLPVMLMTSVIVTSIFDINDTTIFNNGYQTLRG